MIYLILGENTVAKDKKLHEIQSKWLTTKDAMEFDFHKLDGHKLDSSELKKALIELPAVAKKSVIFIRNFDKFSPHNNDLILEFYSSPNEHAVLILDSDSADRKNALVKKLEKTCELCDYREGKKENVFDMTNAMSARNPKEALRILSSLITNGDHPLQIMGGLVWFWGKMRNRLKNDFFKKGLLELQEADLNIKRSRIKSQFALEELVVKLCLLING